MTLIFREATLVDQAELIKLMPRLADFDIPTDRHAEDLWRSDIELLIAYLKGEKNNCFCRLATTTENKTLGFILVSMKDELLSHQPSAHIEALAVITEAEGCGIGQELLNNAECCAIEKGAQSISLHVFNSNTRARCLYNRQGYDEELIRCIKPLM